MSYIYKNGRKFGGNVRIGEDEYEELYLDIPDYQTTNTDDKAIYDAVNSLGWTGVITNAVLNIKKWMRNAMSNMHGKRIFSGTLSSGSASLTDSIENFNYLQFIYVDNDGKKHTEVLFTNGASSVNTLLSFHLVTSSTYDKSLCVDISGSTITVSYNCQAADAGTPAQGTYIIINEIYGFGSGTTPNLFQPLQESVVVTESGTEGIWTYRKWSDGTAECWGTRSIYLNLANGYGSLYYQTFNQDLPSGLFTAVNSVTATRNGLNGGSGNGLAWISLHSTSTSQLGAYVTDSVSQSQTWSFSFHVIGRWR